MIKYVAFLRGINVGGHKVIKMEDLRTIMALPGFKNVATYIQSGNVLFETAEQDQAVLMEKISERLLRSLGYEVEIVLRSAAELTAVVTDSPYPDTKENEVLYVFFMAGPLTAEQLKLVPALNTAYIKHIAQGREIYCLCQKVNGQSNFSNALLERKLKVVATARNITTINKLNGLLA
jgi:uncharacterized protein (DUF1697 family)